MTNENKNNIIKRLNKSNIKVFTYERFKMFSNYQF